MRVSMIAGICVQRDAISEVVRGTAELVADLGWEGRLFTYACDVPGLNTTIVRTPADLSFDDFFNRSDIVLYHFGIYSDLFNTIFVAPENAKKLVFYYNVTPKHLVDAGARRVIEKSDIQKANIHSADLVLTTSRFSRDELVDLGIPSHRISLLPLYIRPGLKALPGRSNRTGPVRVLYVGRFVKSKGVLDLVEALAVARRLCVVPFAIDLVGSLRFSDPDYVASVRRAITRFGLDEIVNFVGDASDEELSDHYRRADIFAMASYHEGFGVPLVEAMRANCLPIAYASGSVPELIGSVGELAPTGDIAALGRHLARHIAFFGRGPRKKPRSASLPLAKGALTLADYDVRRKKLLRSFTYSAFKDNLRARLTEAAARHDLARIRQVARS
jgi:glycosyltransferase involved in cell wall biosynthesis